MLTQSVLARRVAPITLVLAAALSSVMPAGAAQPGSGSIEFSLVATLPTFPCPAPGCLGSFEGTSLGSLAGRDGEIPWTVAWIDGEAEGAFTYADDCDFPVGLASGTGTLTDTVTSLTGTYGPTDGNPLPYPVVKIDSGFSFVWSRVGLNAIVATTISIDLTVVKPGNVFQVIRVIDGHEGLAVAAFAPTGEPPDCANPSELIATVVASSVIAA